MGLSSWIKGLLPSSDPPALPSMREFLDGCRAEAHSYYDSSSEYAQGVEGIRDVFQRIRGRVIAVDIDGTLLSTFMGRREWEKRYRIHDGDRVVRPFANEFLRAIDDSDNRGFLWTGMTRGRFSQMLTDVTGFQVPSDWDVLTREDYLNQLRSHPGYPQLPERIDRYPRLKTKLGEGLVKIPGWINFEGRPIDGLVDDNADLDCEALKRLGLGDQASKLFQVSSFAFYCGGEREPGDVDDVGGLSQYFKDEGLLRVAREIRARWCGAA